jgi:hypothetical protein
MVNTFSSETTKTCTNHLLCAFDLLGSPVKRNASETDGNRHEMRKVRMSSGGGLSSESVSTISSERKPKSLGSPNGEAIMSSSILLVDMNGESTPSPIMCNQIPDPSGSPPESPVLDEEDKSEIEMKSLSLEAKVGTTTNKIVKRLTREVSQ